MNERSVPPKLGPGSSAASSRKSYNKYATMLMELEQRIAFDAAGAATVEKAQQGDPAHPVQAEQQETSAADTDHAALVEALRHTVPETESGSQLEVDKPSQVVFVDSSVPDYDELLQDIKGDYEIVVLDAGRDGVEQMAEVLNGMEDVQAIHIISHGNQGTLSLGSATLTAETMAGEYKDELQGLRSSLADDADIMIYGCNFAQGEAGMRAANMMSDLTGADVAATTDDTGSEELGGNWDLEYRVGSIDTDAIDAHDYDSLLAQTTINPTGGVLASGADGLRIYVTNLGQIQVRYQNQNQFYEPNTTDTSTNLFNGMYMAVGTQVIGPDTGAENMTKVAWTPLSQTLTGSGTAADPYVVTTTMYYNANGVAGYQAAADFQATVLTSYISGTKYFTNTVTVTPPSANAAQVKWYHAADTYLGGSDAGPAYALAPGVGSTTSTSADVQVIATRRDAGTASEVFVGFAEVDGGRQFDRFYSGVYNGTGLYGGIAAGGNITNTITTAASTDNGLGVQFNLGAINAATTFSYRLVFDSDTALDLDANNSTATGNNYVTSYGVGSSTPVAVVDSDVAITNVVADIGRATVTIDNAQTGDALSVVGTLPAGITATISGSTVTLTGSATEAAYQAALRQIMFNSTSTALVNRSLTVSIFNEISSDATTANATINVGRAPVVDLNSGTNPTEIVSNGGFTGTTGWTVSGTGATSNNGFAWTTDSATGTLTQTGITGWDVGSAPSGAAQLTFEFGWNNPSGVLVDNSSSATLEISVGGVVYARITSGNTSGSANTATITYLNGASGSPATVASSTFGAWVRTPITINLPSTVAATGALAFSYDSGGNILFPGRDDMFIDNVSVLTQVDATSGVNFSGAYTENGTPVAIAAPTSTVRDVDSTTMASATIVLTNAFAGDVLNVGALPAGISSAIDTSVAGQITVRLTGIASKADYATAIRGITFSNTGDNPSTTARLINVTVNDGALTSAAATTTISVAAVNDAPVNGLPASGWTTNEDTSLVLNGLSVSDADAGAGTMTVTLTVDTGTLTAANAGGVTVAGSGSGALTLTGTLANINAYLAAATAPVYVPVANANGPVNLQMVANDGGNTGTGGALTDTDTRTITINPVNDAPVLDLDASGAGTGFGSAYTENGPAVAIADTDSLITDIDDTNIESATIVIANAQAGDVLSVAGALPAGITATWNPATFTLTLTGSATKAAYETAIEQIRYSSTSDNPTAGGAATSRTINVTVNDGDANSNTAVATVTITAVNDAPVNTLPGTGWTTNEDTGIALTGLSVADPDVNGGTMTVTLSVGSGTLTALAGGGVTVNGSGTGSLTLTGTLAGINAYLASASAPVYMPAADANAPVTLTMTTNDGGNSGNGGALTDVDTATITINPVNDAPLLDLDASGAGTGFSTTYTEKGAGVAIADTDSLITDVDSANMASATIVIANGQAGDVLSIAGALPAGITASWNPATFTLTLSGSATRAAYETALEQLRYSSTSDNPSTAQRTINVTVNDGAANSNTATATVNVIAVNDAPVNTVPASAIAAEDVLTAIAGISVADVDSGTVTVTLSVASGTLSPSVIAGSVTGNNTGTVTVSGTVAQVNSVLASLRYQGNADFNGNDTLTVMTSDGALSDTDTVAIAVTPVADIVADNVTTTEDTPISFNAITGTNGASADNFESAARAITAVTQPPAGQGTVAFNADGTITYTPAADFSGTTTFSYTVTSGGVTETATVTVTVNAVNDAPVNTLPASGWTTNEDTAVTLTGLSVADPDAGGGTITVTLNVGAGSLTAAAGGNVAVSGTGSATLTLTGTLADINAYLASGAAPVFVPASNANGPVTLTMTTNDGGNTGSGGALTDVDTRIITIAPVNDAPVNTMPPGYTTNEDTALGLTGLQIADIDAGSGTMTVVLSVTSGNLSATAGGGVTLTGSGTSSLTLTGTLASINAFLSGASRPTFTPAADFNGAVTLTMTTSDGGNTGAGGTLSDTDTLTITVNPVNDAPALDLDASAAGTGFSTGYTENGSGVAVVDTDSLITDVDSANMASATLVIANGQAGDVLSISGGLPAGITASWNPATFTLTLTGAATKAAYETALEQVRYSSTSDNPSIVTRTINVSVNDGAADSNTAIATVTVTAVNDAPVNTLPAGGWTVNEDTALALTGLSVTDPDAGTGTVTVTLSVGSGTLAAATAGGVTVTGSGTDTVTLTGTLASINAYLASASRPVYTPVADFNGPVAFTMTSSDGIESDTDTRTITVTPVADIAADTATTNEDAAVTIDVNANDTFENAGHTITAINGTSIVVNGVVAIANGTVRLNADGTLSFTPTADYNGNASFTYTVASGGVTETATVNVTVTAVNDAPVNTVPGAQTTAEDTPLAIGGVAVDDVDGGTLTTILTATNGTLAVTAGGGAAISGNGTGSVTISGTAAQINAVLASLIYNATADYNGPAQLTVQTSDGVLSDTDIVAITVTPVADIVADAVTTNEDTPISFNAITGTNGASADSFENPGRVISAVTQPPVGEGTVTFNANGTITYTPAANFNGTTSFTYTVTAGGVTETTTVAVTVAPVNDAPVNTVPPAQATPEDMAIVFTPSAGNAIAVNDVDGGTLTVTLTVSNGTFSLSGVSGLSFTAGDGTSDTTMTFSGTAAAINAALAGGSYVPTADYNGPAQLTIQTSDGAASDTDTIAINVTPVADISDDNAATDEDTPVTISVLANDTFENTGRAVTAVNGLAVTPGGAAVAVANGTVRLNTAGQLIFTPTTDFNGNVSFTYTVTSGGVTETATVNVAVASINTPPTNTLPATYSTLEDTAIGLTGLQIADADAGSGAVSVTLSVDAGALTAGTAGGVTISGSGTGSITLSGTLANINAYLASASRPTFTPAANAIASVTLTMTTSDNGNTGGPALVDVDTSTITITPVNDAPAGTNKTVTIGEDTSFTFTAADFGFSDPNDNPDNTLAAVVITTVPANGVLSLGGTPVTAGQVITAANIENLTWTPAANANGAALASFTFQVRDNGGTANGGQNTDPTPNTFTINVTAINDAPVNSLPVSYGVDEDNALGLTGLQVSDVDAANGPVTITLNVGSGSLSALAGAGVAVSGSGSGTLVLTGTVANLNAYLASASRPTFNPGANFNGPVTLTMTTSDGGNTGSGGVLTDVDTAIITVAPVNDAPVASDTSIATNEDIPFTGNLPAATDVDGDTLAYGAGATAPAHGTVTINADGSYTYRPAADYSGPDTFTYTVSDGTVTVEYTVTVTVNPLNDAPVAVNDSAQTDADASASVNVIANDTDADGDTLTVAQVNGAPANVGTAVAGTNGGTFTIGANGAAVFNPAGAFADLAAGQTRTTSVTYQVSDGHGGVDTATLTITVIGTDDAPVSTPIANQTSNDAQAVSFDVSGNFSDADAGDILSFSATGLPAGLTIDPATGVISGTVDRSASVSGPYAVTVTATDSTGLQTSRNFTWTVLNPAPVARDDALATTENATISGSVFANNGNGADSDPDGDPIAVSAVGGSAAGVGTAVAGSNGGTFTINADGTYSFAPGTGFDDLAAGQTRTTAVTYTISDGQGGTSIATVSVTVTGQNDAPAAANDTFVTNEDTPVTFDVRSNDSDVDGGTLAVTQIDGQNISAGDSVSVTGGTVTLDASGTLTFTPAPDFNGTPSFTYTVSDGQGGTATATVNGTVNPVQDPPVAADDTFTTSEDVAVTFDVRSNDSDPDGDALSVTQINGTNIAPGGSVAITGGIVMLNANGTLTFTPGADFNGSPSFTYTISDGQGGTATATVNGTVVPVQDAPVAVDDSFTTNEDAAVDIAVLGNDSDADSDPLTVTQIDGQTIAAGGSVSVTGGTVTLNANGTLTFTPSADFNGSPSFTYTISDGQGGTATATVNGTVNPVNDAPVAVDDTFATNEDTAAIFDVRTNDTDIENDALSVTQINGTNIAAGGSVVVAGGTVSLGADGRLTFTPSANFNGSPSFTYTISDGQGGTATATVTGTVIAVNDPPLAGDDSFTTNEDTPVIIDVRANDSDVDGDSITVTQINGTNITIGGSVAVTGGSVMLNSDGTLTFAPDANFNGTPGFTYTVSDGQGGTATATVSGTVAPVNDAPVSSDATVATPEDGTLNGTLPPATDLDGDAVTYAAGSTTPGHGSVTINPDGTYSYVPDPNFNGTDTFSFVVSDGNGGTNEYTVTVNVIAQNDAPAGTPIPDRAHPDGTAVSFDVSGFFSDVDGDTLSFTQTGLPAGLSIDAAGVVSGTVDRQASQGGPNGNGVYSVTVTVSDGHGGTASETFTFTVDNPPPVAVNDSATTNEDTPVTINVLDGSASGGTADSDPDGDPLTVSAASAANGTVTIGANGEITYVPNTNFNGTDTITYTISDGNGGTATATVTVTVNPANDAPSGLPIADRTRNDGDADSIDVSAFFSDADGDTLSYSANGLPPGLAIDPATGVISGTIQHDASGPTGEQVYTVTVTASDGNGGTTPVTFRYTVLNLPPVAEDDTATTAEDTPVDIPILANDSDPDGDTDEVIRVNNVVLTVGGPAVATANGSVQLVLNGAGQEVLRFTPNTNYNGKESFTYTIDDRNGGVDTATVTVTVTPVNDDPVITNPIPDRVRADGQTFNYDVSDFFDDPDGDGLNFVISGLPAGLSYDPATGIISGTIDHNASQGGTDGVYEVTITAYDRPGGTGLSTTQTFDLTVTNPAPTASNDTVTVNEDTAASFNVLTGAGTTSGAAGADTDPDGDTLTVTAASAGNGTVTIGTNGQLTYTPNANFNGTDTIIYTISDGDGGTSTATVTITVVPVNDAPTADPIPTQIDSDAQNVSYDVSGYFDDVDGDTLTFSATGLPPGLSIDPATGLITGTLPADASNNDPYVATITVSDGNGGSVQQTITWLISNLPPKAFSDTLTLSENASGSGDALANDSDPDGDPIAVDQVNGDAGAVGQPVLGSNGGTFVINADGTYTFTPGTAFDDLQLGESRTTTVTYRITDTDGGSDTATITVTVNGVNDAPTAGTIPAYTRADGQSMTANPLNVAAFFSDVEGDALAFSATGLPPGLSMDASGNITGTIANDASVDGPYTVTITASDGNGGTVEQTFTFNVTNPAPTAVNDTATTAEDTPIDSIDVIGNDTDPDGDVLFVDPAFPPQAGHGTVTINPDGTLRYVPDADYNGIDTIVYRVSDGQGGFSTGIVTVDVGAENDAPSVTPIPDMQRNDSDVISLDVTGNFSDPEGDPLTYDITGLPPGLTFNPNTGVISGTIAPNASGPTGTQSYVVTVTASDGFPAGSTSTQFTFIVNNLAPEANNDSATTAEDTPVNIPVLANDVDPDGDSGVVISVNGVDLILNGPSIQTTNGSVRLVMDGTDMVLRFTPNPNYNGTESFTYTIDDGNSGVDTATVTIRVTAVNDAPVAGTIPDRSQPDSSTVSLDVSHFFTDVDGDDLDFTVTGLPPGLSYDPETGLISGTLAADASQGSPYTVTVVANDRDGGAGLSATTSFVFTVTNPAPVAANDAVTTSEDTAVTFNPITGDGTTSGAGGADADADGDPLTVTQIEGQPIAANGTVTVANGTVRLNADGTLTFTPAANFNGTTVIGYRVSDGNGGFADAAITVTVTAVNDVPTIDLDASAGGTGHSATFTEGDSPVAIANGDAAAFDVENQIVSLDVSLAGFVDGGAERIHLNGSVDLIYGTARSGTVTFGGTTFAFTYDGAGGLHFENAAGSSTPMAGGDVSALVRALQYDNASENPTTGARTLTFTVADAEGATSAPAVATIAVTPVNDNPVAVNDTATTGENTPLTGAAPGVLGNDSDPENDALVVTAVNGGAVGSAVTGSNGGSFIVNANGSYSFDPLTAFDDLQAGETRSTTVTYTVSDGNGGTATATLTIVVTGANDAPVGADDTITTVEDTPFTGTLPVATDADGDSLTYAAATQPAHGLVSISADGTYVYTPSANYNGPDSFTYTVNDGTTTVTYTISVNVTPDQDSPVGSDIPDAAYVDAQAVSLDLSGYFTDIDGDTLTFTQTGLPAGLSLDPVTGLVTGTVAGDASQAVGGIYTVTVTATDPAGNPASETFTITVTNPAPIARNDSVSTSENTPVSGSVFANNGNGTDSDPDGDTIVVGAVNGAAGNVGTGVAGSAGGTFTINADGSYTFDPGTDFDTLQVGESRTTSILYTISDGQGGTSTATFTVTVTGQNDAPVGSDTATGTQEDMPVSGTLPVATDVDGDPLTYGVGSQPANGTVTVNPNGTYTYTPNANYNGTDSFTYTVTDGTSTATYTVTVAVGPVNDPPVAQDNTHTIAEDSFVSGAISFTDVDDPLSQITVSLQTDAANGVVVVNANGTYTYTPNPNFNGTDTFVVIVADGSGGQTTATVTINVGPVNDAPIAIDDNAATTENTNVSGNVILDVPGRDSDVDGDTLAVVGVGTAAGGVAIPVAGSNGGTFVIQPDGSFDFDPGADFDNLPVGQTRMTTVTYTISDDHGGTDTATLTITVTGVNDAPDAAALPARSNSDGAPVSFDAGTAFSDADGDTLTFDVTGLPPGLTFDPATGMITGTIDPGASGPSGATNYSVTVTADDGNGGSVARTFTWTVTNPGPDAVNDSFTVAEDGSLSGSVLADNGNGTDGDPDGDPLSVSLVSAPANGSLVLNPDGTFTYVPGANFNGVDSFTYRVSDGNGGFDTATVTISVTPVNDSPVARNDAFVIDEDGTVDIAVLQNDSDIDGDTLTVTGIDGQPIAVGGSVAVTGGTVTLNADGTLRFTANPDFNGAPSFTYTVFDGTASVQATVNGTVRPVNDAPVNTLPPTFNGTEDQPLALNGLSVTDVDAGSGPVRVTLSVDAGTLAAASAAGVTVTGSGTGSITLSGTLTDINAYLAGATAPVYTPVANSDAPVTLTMTTNDRGNTGAGGPLSDSDTATIILRAVNDLPVASGGSHTTPEDTPVAGIIRASDVDGDALTFTLVGQPPNGTVVLDADGTYIYTPNADFSGTETFQVAVNDGHGGITTVTVTVTVTPVNDAPVGQDTAINATEDTPFTGTLPAATDPEGDPLTYGVGAQPGHGTVTVNPDGTYVYTPDPDYNGPDSFTYTVSDGKTTVTYTVSIDVAPVNDPPVGSDASMDADEDTPLHGTLPVATDIDGDTLTYGAGSQPGHGTLVVNPDGTFTYTPDPDYIGPDSFTYTVSDGTTTVTYTVTLNVRPAGETERPPLEIDPPMVFPEEEIPGPPDIAVDGEISGSIGDLGGISGHITADGPIDSVVNAFRSLNGISGLPAEGAVLHAVKQIGNWSDSTKRLDDLIVEPLRGGSIVRLGDAGGERTWFEVDIILNEGLLYVLISAREGGNDVEFRVTQADGRALPEWLGQTRNGVAVGQPPAGTQFIELRAQATTGNGVVEDTFRLDLLTGSISDHQADRRAGIDNGFFSDRLYQELNGSADEASVLARALGNWSALQIIDQT